MYPKDSKLKKVSGNHKDDRNAYESDLNEEVRTLIDLYYESDLVSTGHADFFFDNMVSFPFHHWMKEDDFKYMISCTKLALDELRL